MCRVESSHDGRLFRRVILIGHLVGRKYFKTSIQLELQQSHENRYSTGGRSLTSHAHTNIHTHTQKERERERERERKYERRSTTRHCRQRGADKYLLSVDESSSDDQIRHTRDSPEQRSSSNTASSVIRTYPVMPGCGSGPSGRVRRQIFGASCSALAVCDVAAAASGAVRMIHVVIALDIEK